jgi:hypothetical protein
LFSVQLLHHKAAENAKILKESSASFKQKF